MMDLNAVIKAGLDEPIETSFRLSRMAASLPGEIAADPERAAAILIESERLSASRQRQISQALTMLADSSAQVAALELALEAAQALAEPPPWSLSSWSARAVRRLRGAR